MTTIKGNTIRIVPIAGICLLLLMLFFFGLSGLLSAQPAFFSNYSGNLLRTEAPFFNPVKQSVDKNRDLIPGLDTEGRLASWLGKPGLWSNAQYLGLGDDRQGYPFLYEPMCILGYRTKYCCTLSVKSSKLYPGKQYSMSGVAVEIGNSFHITTNGVWQSTMLDDTHFARLSHNIIMNFNTRDCTARPN